jgi:hypothetical protein
MRYIAILAVLSLFVVGASSSSCIKEDKGFTRYQYILRGFYDDGLNDTVYILQYIYRDDSLKMQIPGKTVIPWECKNIWIDNETNCIKHIYVYDWDTRIHEDCVMDHVIFVAKELE